MVVVLLGHLDLRRDSEVGKHRGAAQNGGHVQRWAVRVGSRVSSGNCCTMSGSNLSTRRGQKGFFSSRAGSWCWMKVLHRQYGVEGEIESLSGYKPIPQTGTPQPGKGAPFRTHGRGPSRASWTTRGF